MWQWAHNPVFCDNLEGWDGVGEGKGVQEGGDICVYLRLIHVDVWQRPTQYCKAIILQLIKENAIKSILVVRKNFIFSFPYFSTYFIIS